LRRKLAMYDREVALVGLLPLPLQEGLGRLALGKDQDAGGLAVQAMDDVDPVSGAGIPLADILVEDGMDRSRLVPLRPDGQEAAWFFHHDDIPVLVKDRNSSGLMFRCGAFGSRHGI